MKNLSRLRGKLSGQSLCRLQTNTLVWSSLLLSIFILTSCIRKKPEQEATEQAEAAPEGGKTLAKLRERGAIKVGFSTFHPWAMQSAEGEWIGFEIDVATKLSKDLGLNLELVPTAWTGIIPALLTNKFDIIIGGMGVTPERAEQVTFSVPYEYAKTVVLLNQNIKVSSLKELNQPEYRFVGRAGSTPSALTRELVPEAQMKTFDDDGLAIQDLVNGQADGFLTDSIEAALVIETYPGTIYLPDWGRELKKEDVAFALPKNAEATWVEYINQWIEKNWDNGFLDEKTRYWFESRDWTKDHQLAE